ncbi:hypothetical protein ACF3OE_05840 [Capnocytophaga canis]|uniref:hypothetical protein n=1 Tax=Capnocytophaga canis TaxID=1848903 RepID=UPI00370D2525
MKKFYFILALLGVFACSEDEHMTADYFKSQKRDSRFFGKWNDVDINTLEEVMTTVYPEYSENGELSYIYRETGEKNGISKIFVVTFQKNSPYNFSDFSLLKAYL